MGSFTVEGSGWLHLHFNLSTPAGCGGAEHFMFHGVMDTDEWSPNSLESDPTQACSSISVQEIQGTEEEIKQYHEEAISQIKNVGSPPGQIPRFLHQINGV